VVLDTEVFKNQPVKILCQIVCQVKGARVVIGHSIEFLDPGEERVAMGARQSLNIFIAGLIQQGIQPTPGTAVTISDKNSGEFVAFLIEFFADRRHDPVRGVVPLGWQALNVDVLPLIGVKDGDQFVGDRATPDYKR